MRTSKFAAALCVATTALCAPVSAAVFDFSYTFGSGKVWAGQLEGDVNPLDPNLVTVTGIVDFMTFDGIVLPSVDVRAFAPFVGGDPNAKPVASFDGMVLDLFTCTEFNPVCVTGDTAYITDVFGNALVEFRDLGISEVDLGFDRSAWSLSAADVAPVPLPAGLPLLLAGLGGLALLRRVS